MIFFFYLKVYSKDTKFIVNCLHIAIPIYNKKNNFIKTIVFERI